jgi:hypothetical protein
MAWTTKKGFNFRATVGYVTDGANQKFVPIAPNDYPQSATIDGDTFNIGWDITTSQLDWRDRTTGNDVRLAGMAYTPNAMPGYRYFNVDLPQAGTYELEVACGDATSVQENSLGILDGTTVLSSFSAVATNANEFLDAGGTVRTAAAWPGSNTPVQFTFATTTLKIRIGTGNGSGANNSTLTHVSVKLVSGAVAKSGTVEKSVNVVTGPA